MRRVHRERLSATAGLLALALFVPVIARAQSELQTDLFYELKTVQSVHLVGVNGVSSGALHHVLKTRVPPWYRPWGERPSLRLDFLRADTLAIRSVYRHAGFLDAHAIFRVLPGKDDDHVVVEFQVVEGARSVIRQVSLEKVRPDLDDDIRNKLWAREKEPFDPGYMQLDSLVISSIYQNHGFRPFISGVAREDTFHNVRIAYRVDEGPRYRIGEVLAHGYQPVKSNLVMRELLIKTGDIERRDRVIRSQERLYETGLFSQVQFTAIPDTDGVTVDYEVRARARPPRWLELGVGSSSSEKVKLNASWGLKNLAGRGMQAALAGQVALGAQFNEFKRARFDVGILEPWLLGVRLRAEAGPFLEWADDHTREKDAGYVLKQSFQGINFQLRRDVNRVTTVRLTQKNTFARQTLTFTDTSKTTDSAEVAIRLNTAPHYRTHSLLLVFERDLRDNFLLTRRGNVTIASVEVAGGALTGTSNFTKAELNQSWFTPIRQMVLASRVRAGVITPFGPQDNVVVGSDDPKVAGIPLQDRFRTGGVNSIRGYNENDIPHAPAYGGLAILQANIELRVPITRLPLLGNLGIEAFVDVGNVWARPEYIRWHQFRPSISRTPYGDQDVRYVFGVGPRFELPIGPLRVDLSWSARPSNTGTGQKVRGYLEPRFQFAIGPSI